MYKFFAFAIIVAMCLLAYDSTSTPSGDTSLVHQKQVMYTFCDDDFVVPLDVIKRVEHRYTRFLKIEAVCKADHYLLVVNAMRYGTKVHEFDYR